MRFKFILVAVVAMVIVGCSSSAEVRRQKYLDADYYTRLEMPPNLTEPSTSQQLSVPKPTDAAMKKFKEDTKDIGKPGYKVPTAESVLPPLKGVTLKTEVGMSWLEVDSNAQQVWPKLEMFLKDQGLPVVKTEPALGIIETDWVNRLQAQPKGWFKKLFSKSPDQQDKFRLRIASDGEGKSRIYVAHTGMEEVEVDGSDFPSWRSRPSDPGLEQEILSRLALYLGLDEQQAKIALAKYGPYASRVISVVDFDPTANEPGSINPSIYLNEGMDDAWSRTQHALDRLNAHIIKADKNKHEYDITVGKLELPKAKDTGEEEDEIAKNDPIMKWFRSLGQGSSKGSAYKIVLSDEGPHRVKLLIQQPSGAAITSSQAAEFRKRLVQALQ